MAILTKSFSEGQVQIDPAAPMGTPRVKFNTLSDPRDRIRMVQGFRMIAEITCDPALAALLNERFVRKPNPAMLAILQNTLKAAALSTLGGIALDSGPRLRRRFLKDAVTPLRDIFIDPVTTDRFVYENTKPSGHPAGTCRMGDPSDSNAVTDSRCTVIGVERLRVVDTSIFPTMMSSGTNLPAIMAAEKAAEMMHADRRAAI
jgi:5-(hydroxymethyl)furfural/furfural oxidase